MPFIVYINGLLLGFSLIMALGPQNIFLMRQGATRQHAFLSVMVCFTADMILVTGSVAGLHQFLGSQPKVRMAMIVCGSAFLLYYGIKNLKQALHLHKTASLKTPSARSRMRITMMALGFSILNPHAIIDSFILIGGGSAQFPDHPYTFLLGVLTASLVWFSALTLTTYYFSQVLQRPRVWRAMEGCSGLLMCYLSVNLLLHQVHHG